MLGKSKSFLDGALADDPILEYRIELREERTWMRSLCRCFIIFLIVLSTTALLLFLLIFVVLPLVFMNSVEFQRATVFQRRDGEHKNPQFTNFRKYGLEGARNLYVTVNNLDLGAWHILPQALVMDAIEDESFSYSEALASSNHPVILYFHGTGGHRISPINTYRVLRIYFHVITFDYRSYADSSRAELTEEGVVGDCVQVYKWLRSQTKAEIFVWGHSLGTSISSNTIAKLRAYGVVPTGLFLEAPFTSWKDVMKTTLITKMFRWMPWFKATILDPVEENGFLFRTIEYILEVDCPVMILHAADDATVKYELSQKLYNFATKLRKPEVQGNLTYRLFPASFGYRHTDIYLAPELTAYIRSHIEVCREANLGKG